MKNNLTNKIIKASALRRSVFSDVF